MSETVREEHEERTESEPSEEPSAAAEDAAETDRAADAIDESATGAERVPADHLDDVEDGCGCAEVWEHLSEERTE